MISDGPGNGNLTKNSNGYESDDRPRSNDRAENSYSEIATRHKVLPLVQNKELFLEMSRLSDRIIIKAHQ